MKTIRQLLRQPAKTIAGIVLVALAVAILSTGLGQSLAAKDTEAVMDYQFSTVALLTGKYNYEDVLFGDRVIQFPSNQPPEEIMEWIDGLSESGLVKKIARHGLISAYIPTLTPDNETRHQYYWNQNSQTAGAFTPSYYAQPYGCAVLEIVLTELEPAEEYWSDWLQEDGTTKQRFMGYRVNMKGQVQRVISLEEGYNDPTGWTVKMNLIAADLETVEKLSLAEGERYLIYGTGYLDLDWQLRAELLNKYEQKAPPREVLIDSFDPEKLTELSASRIEQNMILDPYNYAVAEYQYGYMSIPLSQADYECVRTVSLPLRDGGNSIVRLEGTAEDFLASAAGAEWQSNLAAAQVNQHAFPVIGVDKLGYVAPFAQQTARIVEGRDFTQAELDSGEKVCVVAQSLAAANGLSVGDTISLQYYEYDDQLSPGDSISGGYGTTNPAAAFYGPDTTFAGGAETYTVVGLYRYNNEWGNPAEDLYSFTPNSIFAPKNAVTCTMEYSDAGLFRTIVLNNGTIPELAALVDEAGYEGLFVYYDQGYSEIAPGIHDYQTLAGRAMLVGAGVYLLLLALFLFLFPGRQGRVLAVMGTMGAQRRQKIGHLVAEALGILIPGTVLGCGAGLLLWGRVSEALLSSSKVMLDVRPDVSGLLLAAAAQLILATVLTLLLALPMTRERDLLRRK